MFYLSVGRFAILKIDNMTNLGPIKLVTEQEVNIFFAFY